MLAASGRRQAFRFRWPNLITAVPLHTQTAKVINVISFAWPSLVFDGVPTVL